MAILLLLVSGEALVEDRLELSRGRSDEGLQGLRRDHRRGRVDGGRGLSRGLEFAQVLRGQAFEEGAIPFLPLGVGICDDPVDQFLGHGLLLIGSGFGSFRSRRFSGCHILNCPAHLGGIADQGQLPIAEAIPLPQVLPAVIENHMLRIHVFDPHADLVLGQHLEQRLSQLG